jgi:hypothetical protein
VKKRKTLWRIWAKALGPKEGTNEKEADVIAYVRTVVFIFVHGHQCMYNFKYLEALGP